MEQTKISQTPLLISTDKLVVGHRTPCTYPISFSIKTPGIYAIVGPNGSGKSTLLKTLVGLVPPVSGTFQIFTTMKHAYVPQIHTVNKYFHISMKDFILQGYGPNAKITEKEHREIAAYIKEWQLSEQTEKCFHELSSGQKTRAMIVRTLSAQPRIIFLDEPLSSLDVCCQMQLMQTLYELTKKNNAYIFIVDHHLEKFKSFITERLEFSKQHDEALATVTTQKH